MLIVARRRGQRIVIGSDIQIVVTEVSRGTVKLGIVAPAARAILRGEVYDAIEAANRSAAASPVELSLEPPDAEPRQPAGAAIRQARDTESP